MLYTPAPETARMDRGSWTTKECRPMPWSTTRQWLCVVMLVITGAVIDLVVLM